MNLLKAFYFAVGLGIVLLSIQQCATIVNGTTQDIGVSSSPTEASVEYDGVVKGETPLTLEVQRKKGGTIRIEKNGYEPAEVVLTKTVSGWVFGNIIFGGIPGAIIDFIAGGTYDLSPSSINVTLQNVQSGIQPSSIQKIELGWRELHHLDSITVTYSDSNQKDYIPLNE